MSHHPSISIIINTGGCVRSLEKTLQSLQYLKYPNFEVCVVYGSSPDGFADLLQCWRGRIKAEACEERNLSKSRNIGIALSSGDILAFIDDRAIPEPEWLNEIATAYGRPEVGASGGFVYNSTGVELQWCYGTVDRLARPDRSWTRSAPEFNFPFSTNVPHLSGTNISLRRTAAIGIGGFDEEYDYFLHETDALCRLNDAGWKIQQIEDGGVHHKYCQCHTRNRDRVPTSWYPIVKNKIYFSILNAKGHQSIEQIIEEVRTYISGHRKDLDCAISTGVLSESYETLFLEEIERAWRDGLRRGLSGRRRLMSRETLAKYEKPFLKFNTLIAAQAQRTTCFLTKTYPPGPIGGIGRHIHQLARSIAGLGHQVHVITLGSENDAVDFEDGVWVHRLHPKKRGATMPHGLTIPQHIWDHSTTMLDEVKRIAQARPVDAVFAPIWDCEGIAVLLDGTFKLITGLYTPLKQWLKCHPHHWADAASLNNFVRPMLAAEILLFQQSDAVLADSRAIVDEIEISYGIQFEATKLGLVPLGLDDWAALPSEEPISLPSGTLRVLFVGRLEERKGIDVFLDAAKTVLQADHRIHVDIVGNDTILGANNASYRDAFMADLEADAVRNRVSFHGEVSDAALRGYYRACDIFVAPSRFESFGLILIEAMMFAKPVIGCRTGGMTEIVEHGVSGLLAEPGDVRSLAACLRELVSDPQLRARLGAAGRRRYESSFASDKMARGTLELLSRLPDKAFRSQVMCSKKACSATRIVTRAAALVPHVPHRVLIINSVIARNDAVSACIRDDYRILASDPTIHVSVIAHRNDFPDVPCQIVKDTAGLLLKPEFLEADLIIWHLAIYYELFNAVLIGNGKARQVVRFHNITPKELSSEAAWPLIERAHRQMHHLRYVDEVWNDSLVNAKAAHALGVRKHRNRVVPLLVDTPAVSALADKASSLIEILFVGRFVKSKGVLDLIEAMAHLSRANLVPIRLTLAGNMECSDPAYVEELHRKIAAHGLSQDVVWLGTVDEAMRDALYAQAHILAIPSYHEGFCKPVIEGLRAGCIPVGYASYNLPEIANGLGRMVPAGDVATLTEALRQILQSLPAALATQTQAMLPLDRGCISVADFDWAAHDYVRRFTYGCIKAEVLSHVYDILNLENPAPRAATTFGQS